MLVEDDPDIRIVARLALADLAGFELEVCGSGREALDRAAQFAPDLILLDVMMPELDGPSTLRELRRVQSLEATPVIFMTARAQPEEVAEYRRLGALDVIVKPFDPMALGDQIRGIWSAQEAM
jgi:DNA-binding response OmpR family regulator